MTKSSQRELDGSIAYLSRILSQLGNEWGKYHTSLRLEKMQVKLNQEPFNISRSLTPSRQEPHWDAWSHPHHHTSNLQGTSVEEQGPWTRNWINIRNRQHESLTTRPKPLTAAVDQESSHQTEISVFLEEGNLYPMQWMTEIAGTNCCPQTCPSVISRLKLHKGWHAAERLFCS